MTTMLPLAAGVITAPGLYDLPAEVYHRDPVPEWSLSQSGATKLLRPSCPAKYLHDRMHGTPTTKAMDRGTLAHSLVLGVGTQAVIIPPELLAKNGAASTAEARAFIAEAEAAGNIAVKETEYAQIKAMADAMRLHPVAGRLFEQDGSVEQSMFWRDEVGTMRRARIDFLPSAPSSRGRLIVADYKTARSADPDVWIKAAADYGYHRQDANYRHGVKALGLADDVAFVFVVQEPTAPYLVSVIELPPAAVSLGAAQMDRASRIFANCKASNHWPDYTGGRVVTVDLPSYYTLAAEGELLGDLIEETGTAA